MGSSHLSSISICVAFILCIRWSCWSQMQNAKNTGATAYLRPFHCEVQISLCTQHHTLFTIKWTICEPSHSISVLAHIIRNVFVCFVHLTFTWMLLCFYYSQFATMTMPVPVHSIWFSSSHMQIFAQHATVYLSISLYLRFFECCRQ